MSQIDVNLYDRQIRTYGIKAVEKMSTSSVLIYGLAKGLGTEVGKNLALSGIKTIYLYDTSNVNSSDLETGYYYSYDDIGKSRSSVLAPKLQELNPYIVVIPVDNYMMEQNVTIVINMSIQTVQEINNYSRETSSKMVALWSGGLSGVIFNDANINHLVTDMTGENIEPVQIGSITSEGIVTCAPNSSHDFQSGDTIMFSNIQGDNLDFISEKEYTIKVINKVSFKLNDWNDIENFEFINGTAVHVKKPITINHIPFNEQLIEPTISLQGSFDTEHSSNIVDTYIKMFSEPNIPAIWTDDCKKYKCPELANCIKLEFIPVVSIMGSFAASEAIKLITNKYMPLNQWFTWSENAPSEKPEECDDVKSDYGKLYGMDTEIKLMNSKWFLVGSGAIGCEHLKNLAFMGVKNIIITDPDSIEKSNLNRQFLFRSHHIGKPKSMMATDVIKKLRDVNIKVYLEKVGTDNIEFTNTILNDNITGVLNALDNIKARKFMDEQCFKFGIPLFESGTTGTKGNTQPVIPFLTETYSASSDPDQEKSFPLCTIKSFPNEIQHTIHHAMDQFEFFNRAPASMVRYIQNPSYLDTLSPIEKNQAIEDINILGNMANSWKSCTEWAVKMFMENFHNSIVQLLHTFKPDHEVSPGVKFWSGGKRCPTPIMLNPENSLHTYYIETTVRLALQTFSMKMTASREELIEEIKMVLKNIPEFRPKEMTIASSDSELEKIQHVTTNNMISIMNSTYMMHKYVPQEFEKDDDTNNHIDWINVSSNMRATNYGIVPVTRQDTKGIAGRIIPAIATTTSAVSGLILIEMLKYIVGVNKLDKYRSTFINLASPILIHSDPMEAHMIDVAGVKVNEWTTFDYKKDTTLGEFKKYYEDMFKTEISMIVIGTAMAYAEFLGSDTLEKKLSEIIKDTMGEMHNNVTFSLASDNDIEFPNINVKLT